MPPKHSYLGKIFISHSSVDKPFVQKLVTNLKNDGFESWYDDNELLVGEELEKMIIQAINNSKLFIVVISSAALKSPWLEFEITHAKTNLGTNICRIIPVLIEEVEIPSLVSEYLYSKFTESFSYGYNKLLKALSKEAYKEFLNQSFYTRTKFNLELFYGESGWASISDTNGFSEIYYNNFAIDYKGDEKYIIYKIVPKNNDKHSLDSIWLEGYFEQVIDKIDEFFFLVVSEKPILLESDSYPEIDSHILIKEVKQKTRTIYLIFIDLSDSQDNEWQRSIIEKSRSLFME